MKEEDPLWQDIRVDTHSPGSEWSMHRVRLTHLPSGVSVLGAGTSQFLLRKSLLEELKERLRGEGMCPECGVALRKSRHGGLHCGTWGCRDEDPTGGER